MSIGSRRSRRRPGTVADQRAAERPEPAAAAGEPLTISREEILEHLVWGEIILLDAQAPGWFERERIPGAMRALPEDLDSLASILPNGRETPIAVYCWDVSCGGSALIAQMLVERGYRRVRRYRGGKRDWIDVGLPVERGVP
jgi:rhodanese-related sulfurtransferase